MQDSIEFITSKYDTLSIGEKRVADFVIANLHDAVTMSVHEFSEHAGISVATAVRFCRKLGFKGYRDFCIQMAQSMNSHVDYVMDMHGCTDDVEEHIHRVLLANAETIRTTLAGLDYPLLRQVAHEINQCRNLLFVGMGTSQIVCQDATLRFLRAGKQVVCYADSHASIVAVSHYGPEDIVVGISHSGTTQEVYEVLQIARSRGARTIGITTYPQERISDVSDVVLRTQTRESPMHKVAITSRTGQLAIIDALFIAVINDNADQSLDSVMRVSSNISQIERFEFPKRSNHDGTKGAN